MIPATPGPKIPEDGPEPEFRPEFLRNFEPSHHRSCIATVSHSTNSQDGTAAAVNQATAPPLRAPLITFICLKVASSAPGMVKK